MAKKASRIVTKQELHSSEAGKRAAAAIVGKDSLGSRIADAIGLKNCRRLTLHFEVGCLATVEAECLLLDDSGMVAECFTKRYTADKAKAKARKK